VEASPDAIAALRELCPDARWAWYGKPKHGESEELNRGQFALLQLYRRHEASGALYEQWGDKGPIFGAPFDRDRYEPLWLANFTPEDVFALRFVPVVRRWMRPLRARLVESAQQRGLDYENEIKQLAGRIGDEMWWRSQRSTDTPIVVPKKFLTKEDKAVLCGDAMRDVRNDFMPYHV
jgi:hypothetical protein